MPLPPKSFDLLLFLVENSGHVLDKEELMKQIWPDSFVEEQSGAEHFHTRGSVGRHDAKFSETVPKRGYRFVADVGKTGDGEVDLIVRESIRQRFIEAETGADETKGASSGGGKRTAYSTPIRCSEASDLESGHKQMVESRVCE